MICQFLIRYFFDNSRDALYPVDMDSWFKISDLLTARARREIEPRRQWLAFLGANGISEAQVAEVVEPSQAQINQATRGRRPMSQHVADAILEVSGVKFEVTATRNWRKSS